MDAIAMENLISSIVAESVKSILPAILASLQGKPESVELSAVPAISESRKAKKAGKLIKSAATDIDAFNIVKRYVLARKAGKIEKGPFLTCYRHISESSTLDDVLKASPTAKATLLKEAQKVLNYKA
jgi:hypothetical protein